MKKNTIKKNKIRKDCWCLDYAFFKWLKERLPVYLHDASQIVNLEYHKFEYQGKTYTQKEMIEMLIKLVNDVYSRYFDYDEDIYDKAKQVIEIWGIIFPAMWW